MNSDVKLIAGKFDVSAVQSTSTRHDVTQCAELAKQYGCIAVFSLSCFTDFLKQERERLGAEFRIGATVGYPSGQTSTEMKVAEAGLIMKKACDEVDMVLNIGYLLSGMYREALDDIKAVKKEIGDTPLKVIIETPVLTPEQIADAAKLVVDGGAQWVKTSTGWTKTGTTAEQLKVIRDTVGGQIKIKAAGGIGSYATVQEFMKLGVERFGVGRSARKILEEIGK